MKLAHINNEGILEIIVPVNVTKTRALFPDAIELEEELPDEFFRPAWELSSNSITINLDKAKEFCHEKRRVKREKLFAPFDKIISAQIPGNDISAIEASREQIRSQDTIVQNNINQSDNAEDLKILIQAYENLGDN